MRAEDIKLRLNKEILKTKNGDVPVYKGAVEELGQLTVPVIGFIKDGRPTRNGYKTWYFYINVDDQEKRGGNRETLGSVTIVAIPPKDDKKNFSYKASSSNFSYKELKFPMSSEWLGSVSELDDLTLVFDDIQYNKSFSFDKDYNYVIDTEQTHDEIYEEDGGLPF